MYRNQELILYEEMHNFPECMYLIFKVKKYPPNIVCKHIVKVYNHSGD